MSVSCSGVFQETDTMTNEYNTMMSTFIPNEINVKNTKNPTNSWQKYFHQLWRKKIYGNGPHAMTEGSDIFSKEINDETGIFSRKKRVCWWPFSEEIMTGWQLFQKKMMGQRLFREKSDGVETFGPKRSICLGGGGKFCFLSYWTEKGKTMAGQNELVVSGLRAHHFWPAH